MSNMVASELRMIGFAGACGRFQVRGGGSSRGVHQLTACGKVLAACFLRRGGCVHGGTEGIPRSAVRTLKGAPVLSLIPHIQRHAGVTVTDLWF